jgi:hypothetical protein
MRQETFRARFAGMTFLILLFSTHSGAGEEASGFPKLETESLSDQPVAFPEVLNGAPTFLVVGFTKGSQVATKACADQLEKEFPGRGWSMAVLEGIPFFIKGTVRKAIRKTVPANRMERYLFLYDGKQALKKAVGFEDSREDDAYVIGLSSSESGQGEARTTVSFRFHGDCLNGIDPKLKNGVESVLSCASAPGPGTQEHKPKACK